MLKFTPFENFVDEDSEYCAGLWYTVLPDNSVLAEKVADWQQMGLVRVESGYAPRLCGRGTVH